MMSMQWVLRAVFLLCVSGLGLGSPVWALDADECALIAEDLAARQAAIEQGARELGDRELRLARKRETLFNEAEADAGLDTDALDERMNRAMRYHNGAVLSLNRDWLALQDELAAFKSRSRWYWRECTSQTVAQSLPEIGRPRTRVE